MKIFITSIGTRGDVEPFLSIGEKLKENGHQISFAFPQQFSKLVPKTSTFFPLSPKIIELIQSKQGQIVMGKANMFAKLKALLYLYKQGKVINNEIAYQHFKALQVTTPELIIHNAKCSYPFIWGLKQHIKTVLISPVPYIIHKVNHHPHLGFRINLGTYLNRLTYKLANFGIVKSIFDIQKTMKDNSIISKKEIHKALINKKIVYNISPSLFKAPKYWPQNAKVFDHIQTRRSKSWSPQEDLKSFLKAHPKAVFLSFGSMQNTQPKQTSKLLYAVFDKLKIPVIVNIAEKGLIKIDAYNRKDQFLFVDEIPYEWIMPKVYAVVHHGGSGTTHAGVRCSCPTLIIPHIIDQYAWNTLVYKLGIGPKGKSINRITSKTFENLLKDLYLNKTYKMKAQDFSNKMYENNDDNELLNFITA